MACEQTMAVLVFTEPLITRMNVLSLGIRLYCKLLLDLCHSLHSARGRHSTCVYCQLVESDWTIVNESIFAELFFSLRLIWKRLCCAPLHISEGVFEIHFLEYNERSVVVSLISVFLSFENCFLFFFHSQNSFWFVFIAVFSHKNITNQ